MSSQLWEVNSQTNVAVDADLALKENVSNKSTDTALGTSDSLYPSQNAVKSYADTAIAAIVDSSPATLNTLNELAAALWDDANYATSTATAIGLKEDSANKSTSTALGTSDTLFPTQNAVKEYTDSSISKIDQNSKSAAYTTVLSDAGKHIYHPSADTTARTFTIDSNANVAYPIGTAITFVNDTSAWELTIAITTDTMILAWDWSTWSRTLAANWIASAIKMTATRWIISWNGLT